MAVEIEAFREEYRAQRIPERYSGELHLCFAALMLGGGIVVALLQLDALQPLELVVVPLTLLLGNVFEYFVHRYPLHHRRPGLGVIFRIHTLEHHRFFTMDDMEFQQSRDFHMVFLPVWSPPLAVFLGLPLLSWPIWELVSANAGLLFFASGAAYFALYEAMHFSHHMGERWWIGRAGFLRHMRTHHAIHHDQQRLRYNLNVTLPLSDLLFGTLWSAPESEQKGVPPADDGETGAEQR